MKAATHNDPACDASLAYRAATTQLMRLLRLLRVSQLGRSFESLIEPLREFRRRRAPAGVRLRAERCSLLQQLQSDQYDSHDYRASFLSRQYRTDCRRTRPWSDYLELVPHFRDQVKAVIALGETRNKIARAAELAGLTDIIIVEPEENAEAALQQAVRDAASIAKPGDVVLLSPACASWDMFKSYEQRGRIFKQSAHTL